MAQRVARARGGGWCLGILLGLSVTVSASGQGLSQEEALRIAFPEPALVERRTAFLSDADLERVRALAGPGNRVSNSIVTYYVGSRDGERLGIAYFDAHRVRTLNEVLMIVVSPAATIVSIEVLRFSEPPDYHAPAGWLDQFDGKALTKDLSTKGNIINLTGATLTSRATTAAARRVLAYHTVIWPAGERENEP